MSVLTEVLDRLSGITVVREKLNDTTQRIDKIADWLLDHERRLITIETNSAATVKKMPSPKGKKK